MEYTTEQIKALFFDENAIRESPYTLYRYDSHDNRLYYTDIDNNLTFYLSVTTFAKRVLPTGFGLMEWYKNKSKDEIAKILKDTSNYGTLLDIFNNELLINGTFDLDCIESRVIEVAIREKLIIDIPKWIGQLKKDLLAFAQWVKDYEVVPLLVSCPLKSDKNKIAGTLDLYCEMNNRMPTKTIKPIRVKALCDYKAKIGEFGDGERNSFYESEEFQLVCYKDLVKENFPDLKIDMLFNWSPKNWRTNPSYNLKDQTNTRYADKMKYYYNLLEFDFEKTAVMASGIINLKEPLDQNYKSYSITELINMKKEEKPL